MTDRHEHLDEGTIHAWLDGALPPDESARVEAQSGACAECAALLAEARGLVAASSRILSSLDDVPGGVIPGHDGGVDQLAVLRAKRKATQRRWWHDRRIVAAASVLFVAGASSLIWRSSANQSSAVRMEQVADAPTAAPDAASATTPAEAGNAPAALPAAARELPSRDAKAEARAPQPDPTPVRVAATRVTDSAEQKVAGASTSLTRGEALAANETRLADSGLTAPRRLALDSTTVLPRLPQSAVQENQFRQQGAPSAQQQVQQSLRQQGADVARPAAPPPAMGAGSRLGQVSSTAARARMDEAKSEVGGCYRLPLRAEGNRRSTAPDTVQLLDEMLPFFSDPTFMRARRLRVASDTTLMWRSVDSITIELRSHATSDSVAVRFSTTGTGLPLPDAGREPGVRAVLAVRVGCP